MRKFFSLVVASILATTSLFAAEVTVTKTIAQVQAYNNWETQYVDDKGFWHRTLNLDENIQLAALPESPESTSTQNGILYLNTTTSAPSDWRIYQARGGFQIIAKEGCVLKSATFEFGNKNNGCLVYGGKNYTTGQTITFDGTKALEEIAVGSTSGKTNGQARITSFTVVYEKKETPTPATKTIYCKMEQGWWKADNAAVGCHYWGTPGPGTSWPGVRMTPVEGETDLWSIDLDLDKVQNVIFTRVNPSGAIADWGAKTKDLEIPTDDKNLFTITTSSESWGDPGCDGTWSVYGGAVEKPKHNYTITVYLPAFCDDIAAYADSARVMGGFDDWSNGIWMEKKIDEDFNDCWYAEIYDVEEGTAFKLRFGTDADWKVQVQLNGANMANEAFGETTDIVLHYDGEGYGFAACPAPVARKEFVFVAGEAADSDPAMFAITWGKDGSSEQVKMEKEEETLYAADILATVDSVVLVRCATGATEIIWDGEGKNVWNQTANYELCDTMYFESWVEETNLFAIKCDTPEPVETKYYAKNNWNGAASEDWSWLEMKKEEDLYVLDSVVFGGTGVNINTKEDDTDAKWFDLKKMKYNEQDTIQALDTVRFELAISEKDTVLTAILLGRPAPAARKEFVFVAGEAAEANPAMFAITWGKDGSNETVKLANKADDIYTAEILETVDSLVLVRCATGATEIIWDGEGKNVWNQTANYELCDTMYFESWVEETNLFAIKCDTPEPVETKYYAKNNWNGAASEDWSWLEMKKEEDLYVLDSVVFGGTGVNINTKEDDTDAKWFDLKKMKYNEQDTIQALDTVRFELAISEKDTVLTAILLGRPAPAARKEFVFVAGEAADSDPAMFAITWGKDGSSETVKMEKQEEALYAADILATVDSVVLVRCATGATEIIWDGEGKNIWNQTANYALCDTMYFESWVPETNLFAVTCEAPQPVETKYYAKNNWNNGEWTWLEMSATDQENVYMLDSVVFGGTGVNINTKADDADALWFKADSNLIVIDATGDYGTPQPPLPQRRDTIPYAPRRAGETNTSLLAGDTILLAFNAADSTLTAFIVGRPQPVEHKFYVTGNAALVGEEKAWQADAIEMVDYTHTFPMLAAGEYQLKVTDGTWEHAWGYDNLSPTVAVEGLYTDVDGNICFTVYTPNDVTVTFAQGYVVVTGDFKNPQPVETKYYITGNEALCGEKAWDAQAIEMKDSTYTFTELAAGEYEMKITNGAWDPEGQSWGSAALSEDCSAGVGDKNGNIHFIVETPNNVVVSIANGKVTVTGTFKEEPVTAGITVNVTVPEGTPACFFYGEMSGNTFVEMTKVDDTHYTTTFAKATSIGWGYLFAWEAGNWNTKNAEGDFKVEPVNGVINVEVKAWVTAPGTEYKYTTYTEWQVKYGPAWEWVNTTKQEDGTFTVEAVWGNTGINIASGENPIKQDWYPLDDAALTVAEDVVEGDNVVITLTVVDDETVALNVKKGQEPATSDFGLLVNGTDYLPGTPEDKDTYTEYAVNTQLTVGEFVQLYDNVNKAAWTVTPEGSGFTDFEMKNDAYYIKQAGSYQFYIKIPKEGMESGLYVGFQGSGTNLNKVKAAQGQRFNVLGLPVNANYRGVVIMNGQTYLQ